MHKLPEWARIAWNGTHLFYVDPYSKTFVKCQGDAQKPSFGKIITKVGYSFMGSEQLDPPKTSWMSFH